VADEKEELEGVTEEIDSLTAELQNLKKTLTLSSGSMNEMARESVASAGGGGEGAHRDLDESAGDCGGVVLIEKKCEGEKLDKAQVNMLLEGPGGVPDDTGLFSLLRNSDEWMAKWFVCQDGNMSIHEDEAAWHRFEAIAIIPADMLKVSDPKVRHLARLFHAYNLSSCDLHVAASTCSDA
jgi:hypothetical protein